MTDKELVDIAKAVYRSHKAALDFIFEQRPDYQNEIRELVVALIGEYEGQIGLARDSRTYINFFPKAWNDVSAFNAPLKEKWTGTGHSLLFEIRNTTDFVKMVVVIGPAEDGNIRRSIWDFSRNNSDQFPDSSPSLYEKYTQIYSKTIVDRTTLIREPIEEIKRTVDYWFKQFMDGDFEKVVELLYNEFSEIKVE